MCGDNANDALDGTPYNKRMSVAVALDHAVDGKAGEDRAKTVARGGETCCQPASVREPAHHQAYNSNVDDAGSKTADEAVGEVERPNAIDVAGQNPTTA